MAAAGWLWLRRRAQVRGAGLIGRQAGELHRQAGDARERGPRGRSCARSAILLRLVPLKSAAAWHEDREK